MNPIVELNKTTIKPYYNSQLKSITAGAINEMKYNDGDILRLTANLNEMQSVLNSFIATQDETIEFTFNSLITFEITDGTSPISGASININSEILTTDEKGITTVALPNGTYPYTVSATGYDAITDGSLIVNDSAFINQLEWMKHLKTLISLSNIFMKT
jgi:hypothetical protein